MSREAEKQGTSGGGLSGVFCLGGPQDSIQDVNQVQTISPKESRGLTAPKGTASLAAHSSLEYTPVVAITPEAGGELAFRSLGQLSQQS